MHSSESVVAREQPLVACRNEIRSHALNRLLARAAQYPVPDREGAVMLTLSLRQAPSIS